MSLWDTMTAGLEPDERIVYPHWYLANPTLYDKIVQTGYLVRERREGSEVTWCSDSTLERVLSSKEVEVLDKVLIVRLRLPWNKTEFEWYVSEEELRENEADYNVVDTMIKARDTETGDIVIPRKVDLEEQRERYEVLEVRYFVVWKPEIELPTEEVRTYISH